MVDTTRELWVSLREQEGLLLSLVSLLTHWGEGSAECVAAMGFSFSFTQAAVSNIRQVRPISPHSQGSILMYRRTTH
jgi:hypothetical protein